MENNYNSTITKVEDIKPGMLLLIDSPEDGLVLSMVLPREDDRLGVSGPIYYSFLEDFDNEEFRYEENKIIKVYGYARHNVNLHALSARDREVLWERSKCKNIDWSKVEVDTLIQVKNFTGRNFIVRHFAKYEDGIVYAWRDGLSSKKTDVCYPWHEAKLI